MNRIIDLFIKTIIGPHKVALKNGLNEGKGVSVMTGVKFGSEPYLITLEDKEHMLEALNKEPDATPEKTLKNMRQAVDAFVEGAEQFDDLTMLCMEYKGLSEKKRRRDRE